MIEVLFSTIVIFVLFLIVFIFIPNFKVFKILVLSFQLFLSFILLINSSYKNLSLYKGSRIQNIQTTDFYPIASLYKTYYENGTLEKIGFKRMNSNKFSIMKTNEYATQCLENYFIRANESCPITDIKLEKTKSNEYQNYIQISDKEYLYFTRENKLGRLYKSFDYSDFREKKENTYVIDKVGVRKELNKLNNPVLEFKYHIQFYDVLCSLLIFISIYYSYFESNNELKFDWFRSFNLFQQFIILILYIIRFSKFLEMKKFLFENKDIYKNESYFPNKIFNTDNFPLAISINIFIFNIFYIFFNKESERDDYYLPKEKLIIFSLIPFQIAFVIFGLLDLKNNLTISKVFDNLIYNWNMNPIKYISLSQINESKNNFQLRKDILELERMENFDYINIFSNNNSKLCGKDNLGNNLYFPKEVECPINKIIISEFNNDLQNYTKLKLNSGKYLYFTNQFFDGKIVSDLRISTDSELPSKPGGGFYHNFFTFPFYEEIDFDKKDIPSFSRSFIKLDTIFISK